MFLMIDENTDHMVGTFYLLTVRFPSNNGCRALIRIDTLSFGNGIGSKCKLPKPLRFGSNYFDFN
jgi:hypothetical protein